MVTQQQVATGVGAGALGVGVGETIQRAGESGRLTDRQAALLAGGVGATTLWAAVLGELDVIPLGDRSVIGLAGFGLGEVGWFAGRRLEAAPRLTLRVPDEVNLASPLINSAVFGLVGAGAATAVGLVR